MAWQALIEALEESPQMDTDVLVRVPEGLSFEVSSKACTPRLRLTPTRGRTANTDGDW